MPFRERCWVNAAFVLWALVLNGCGGSKLVSVSGTITKDGSPLADASVTLYPAQGGGSPGVGTSDSNGHFKITTGPSDGAAPGEYKVIVVAQDNEAQKKFDQEMMSGKGSQESGKRMSAVKSLVHSNYSDPTKTPLKVTIPPGTIKVELKTDGT